MAVQSNLCEVSDNASQPTVQRVHCPNCGRDAEREYLEAHDLIRLQCPHCDYLLVTCARTGNVREAYAPGLAF